MGKAVYTKNIHLNFETLKHLYIQCTMHIGRKEYILKIRSQISIHRIKAI